MGIVQVRGLGKTGLITDQDGFSLPLEVLTTARNCRFSADRVKAGACFRVFKQTSGSPVFAYTLASATDYDRVLVADQQGTLRSYAVSLEEDVTPTEWGPSPSEEPWSACTLAGLHYICRGDRAPVLLRGSGSKFESMANWPSNWRAVTLAAYGDCLVALGTQEGGQDYPNRIRWSTFAQAGAEPASWADDSAEVTSGSNYLSQMRGPIVDGLALGQDFIIYGSKEVYRMRLVGGREVMAFRPVWDDFGVLGAHCVTAMGSQHVVFGDTDIILHDGVSKKSICDARVRRRIFNSLDWDAAERSFVVHDRVNQEIWFCYRSIADDVFWPSSDWCNEAAVWNYGSDTWVFRDLPNVSCGSLSNAQSSETWEDNPVSWDTEDGSWSAGETSGGRGIVFAALTSQDQPIPQLLILDGYGRDQRLQLPLYGRFKPDSVLGRDYINLDAVGLELRGYKRMRTLYPEVSTEGAKVFGRVGGALYPNLPMTYGREVELNPNKGFKIDALAGGRFVGWRLRVSGQSDWAVSGLDLDVISKGRR